MENWFATVVSQYANSPVLLALIESFNDWIDPTARIDALYDLVLNLDTAQGVGLDRWGRIVGVNRVLAIDAPPDYLGFEDGVADWQPFGQAPFNAGLPVTQNYSLSDDAFRQLILIKAAANISATTAPVLNRLLRQLFPDRGRAYVNALGRMAMRYTFEFYLQPFELALLESAGVLPRPTGVAVYLVQQPQFSTFGFAEAGQESAAPFGQGAFLRNGASLIN